MTLLDYYKSRFGEAVKRQGGAWNGPCPLCGGEPGKSDRFMIWPDRAENLGEVCARTGSRGSGRAVSVVPVGIPSLT